ncbi:MAG: hypothetical protein SFV19_02795 [Rhodospirillaceae bacterium]|nr:hypothetical protein [Rhodospirillaceae bacterium]
MKSRHMRLVKKGLTYALIAASPLLGVLLAALAIYVSQTPANLKYIAGPVAPGRRETFNVAWPKGDIGDSAVDVVMMLAITPRVARDIRISVGFLDPDLLGREVEVHSFKPEVDGQDGDLIEVPLRINMLPHLTTLRGTVRQLREEFVGFTLHVTEESAPHYGHVYLLSAEVETKPWGTNAKIKGQSRTTHDKAMVTASSAR